MKEPLRILVTFKEADGEFGGGAGANREQAVTLPTGRIYIHLVDGRIEEVYPATNVYLTADELVVLHGERIVARYDRANVYLATDIVEQPIPCC